MVVMMMVLPSSIIIIGRQPLDKGVYIYPYLGNRGSFTDEENISVDNIVKGIEEGSNKRRISGLEGK
jgi:hypothetical protein